MVKEPDSQSTKNKLSLSLPLSIKIILTFHPFTSAMDRSVDLKAES